MSGFFLRKGGDLYLLFLDNRRMINFELYLLFLCCSKLTQVMKKVLHSLFIVSVFCMVAGCSAKEYKLYHASDPAIRYAGRTFSLSEKQVQLIGSASSASFRLAGDSCVIFVRNNTPEGRQNYFSVDVDGSYVTRFRISGDSVTSVPFKFNSEDSLHTFTITKSTEAANGNLIFEGVWCKKLEELPPLPKTKIEFIGNSITCGYGVDCSEIPCHKDQWYDQHNAYLAYGPTVSRMLDVQFMLSSVSGIGIYRNWNTDGPTMPMVYENLYLNTDSTHRWDFSRFTPDIVSVCLGTNDFSDGDGVHERLPFDADRFTYTYIKFVETIYSHYPNVQIALLSSPMLSGEKDALLKACLQKVKSHFDAIASKPIVLFYFEGVTPHGCDYHPDMNDQQQMAEQLYPFFKDLIDHLN
jgi:hypothetical protein